MLSIFYSFRVLKLLTVSDVPFDFRFKKMSIQKFVISNKLKFKQTNFQMLL